MNMFSKLWKKRETAEENIMTVQTGKEIIPKQVKKVI